MRPAAVGVAVELLKDRMFGVVASGLRRRRVLPSSAPAPGAVWTVVAGSLDRRSGLYMRTDGDGHTGPGYPASF